MPVLGTNYIEGVRIVARRALRELMAVRAPGTRTSGAQGSALDAWFDEARKISWSSTADVMRLDAPASVVSADRVVIDIRCNRYRSVAAINSERGIVWIGWVGAHADYDRIDVAEVEHHGGG